MNIKKLIGKFTVWLASFLYRGIKYKSDSNLEGVKVNLGCGLKCLAGWVNIDANPIAILGSRKFTFINKILYKLSGSHTYFTFNEFNEIIQKATLDFYDLRRGVPFGDKEIDIVYSSHFLEHLNKDDGNKFLKECFRVLKEGGLMRIVVPDLEFAFEMYKKGDIENMLKSFFFIPNYYNFSVHKYGYNFQLLKDTLKDIGFKDIKKMDYKKGDCPDIDFLDVGTIESLYVECWK